MTEHLVYWAYGVAAIGAATVYAGLPKGGRPDRRVFFLLLMAAGAIGVVTLMDQLLGEQANRWAFGVLSLLGVGAAVRVVTHPKPVYAALYFILVILSTAAMLIMVGAEFLGIALVIVYAGAILVTYVFVIMLAQQPMGTTSGGRLASVFDYDRSSREPFWAVLASFVLMATVAGMIAKREWLSTEIVAPEDAGSTLALGKVLMTDFAVSVELAAVLLTVAMVGAIAIARKRLPKADEGKEMSPPGKIGREVEPF